MADHVEISSWSGLRIDVARLRRTLRQPGGAVVESVEPIRVHAALDAPDDLAITTGRIPAGSEVGVDGVLDVSSSGIVGRLRVTGGWEAECRRCLDPVAGIIDAELEVPFVDLPSDVDLTDAGPDVESLDDAEAYPVVDDRVDLELVVRDELMLALPLSPLCADDCAGADPDRFPATGPTDEGADTEPEIDPRWAALSEIRFDDGE